MNTFSLAADRSRGTAPLNTLALDHPPPPASCLKRWLRKVLPRITASDALAMQTTPSQTPPDSPTDVPFAHDLPPPPPAAATRASQIRAAWLQITSQTPLDSDQSPSTLQSQKPSRATLDLATVTQLPHQQTPLSQDL